MLGLLEAAPKHGYELKRLHDRVIGGRGVAFGQVYATLSRLARDGLVELEGLERGEGPDRKRYRITGRCRRRLAAWIAEPVTPEIRSRPDLFSKIIIALLSGRSATDLLDRQRAVHLEAMRELTRRKRTGALSDALAADYGLLHLEADLRWIELAARRLEPLRQELTPRG
jgi:DNA-binding PadR family transcriptional regulator